MDEIILDTSIVVKWFVQEEKSPEAQDILEKIKNGEYKLVVPRILILELINALFSGNTFPTKGILDAITQVENLNPEWIDISQISKDDLVETTLKRKIASYDALFLVLAENKKIPLITADTKHRLQKFSKYIQYL